LTFIWLIVALTAFVQLAPVSGDGGLEALGHDLLLLEGGGLQAYEHEVFIDHGIAANGGSGCEVPYRDEQLQGGAQQVDVFYHPVVRNRFPNVFLQVHIIYGLWPGGDDRAAEGCQGLLAELSVECFVYESAGEVDAGVGGDVGLPGVDLDHEVVAALVGGDAVVGDVGGHREGDIVHLVVPEGGQDRPQSIGRLGSHKVHPYAGDDGVGSDRGGRGNVAGGCPGAGASGAASTGNGTFFGGIGIIAAGVYTIIGITGIPVRCRASHLKGGEKGWGLGGSLWAGGLLVCVGRNDPNLSFPLYYILILLLCP
jgi:hypothetical protein